METIFRLTVTHFGSPERMMTGVLYTGNDEAKVKELWNAQVTDPGEKKRVTVKKYVGTPGTWDGPWETLMHVERKRRSHPWTIVKSLIG